MIAKKPARCGQERAMDQELRAAGRIRLDGNRVIVEPLTSTGEACLRQMAETGAIVAVVIEPMDALTACERAAAGSPVT
jgi:hypothetical protein